MTPRALLQHLSRVADRGSVRVGSPTRTEHIVTALTFGALIAAAGYTRVVNETPLPPLAWIVMASCVTVATRTRVPKASVLASAAIDLTYIVITALSLTQAGEPLYASKFGPAPIATIMTTAALAYRAQHMVTWTLAGTAAIAVGGATAIVATPEYAGEAILFCNMILFAAVPGSIAMTRAEKRRANLRERADLEHRAAIAERLRIARELHDTLAHNLTLVNAQASVAEYLLELDPQRAAKALQQISHHSSEALADVRSTVGLLRYGDATSAPHDDPSTPPTPSLAMLDSLVDTHRGIGARIDCSVEGTRPAEVPSLVDATGYRIVQECLTNASKHAPGAPVRVSIRWHPDEVRVHVANRLSREEGSPTTGSRQGLLGMEERVRALKGTLAAGRVENSFSVEATLPIAPTRKVEL